MRMLLTILVLAPLAGCAAAGRTSPPPQEAAYARTPGDTLRYTWKTQLYDPDGPVGQWDSVSARRSRVLAIAFTGGDTARAWIESLQLETTGEDAHVDTAGPDVVGLPFVLRVGPLGSDSVLAAPQFPEEWSGSRGVFNRFFPRLPGGPLRPGRSWSESKTADVSDSLWIGEFTRDVSYRVVGSSTLHGARVVVVAFDLEETTRNRRREDGAQLPANLPFRPTLVQTQTNEEHGRFYFAPRTGRLLRVTREGIETLEVPSFTSAEAAVREDRYRSTLELVVDARR